MPLHIVNTVQVRSCLTSFYFIVNCVVNKHLINSITNVSVYKVFKCSLIVVNSILVYDLRNTLLAFRRLAVKKIMLFGIDIMSEIISPILNIQSANVLAVSEKQLMCKISNHHLIKTFLLFIFLSLQNY